MKEFLFDNHFDCLKKWEELKSSGVAEKNMTLIAPHPVHGLDEKLDPRPSRLRYVTLISAIFGCLFGFAFTIYCTVYSWGLVTGGKPLNSIAAYIVIAYELTILFGGVLSFKGFLFLARLPNLKQILSPADYGNQYAILVEEKE